MLDREKATQEFLGDWHFSW